MEFSPAERETSPSLLIVDSFALLFRGFFATASTGNYMRNASGICTNGLFQFTRYLLDAVRTFNPTHVVCAFDMGSKTFRNELYPEYKSHRAAPPDELVPQFSYLWDLVKAFDIPCIGLDNFEADDVIGSFARRHASQQMKVRVLTGDGDTLQLVDEHTEVILMKKGLGNYLTIGLHNLEEEKGIEHPHQIVEMKALMGDASDNIPGCPQVGPKTALKLIREFGTVDELYARIEEVKGKLKERLLEHKDLIYLSRDLATIRTDLHIQCELEQCSYRLEREKVAARLEQLDFGNITKTIAG